jgi:hypothetical protein
MIVVSQSKGNQMTTTTYPASIKQVGFIKSLISERAFTETIEFGSLSSADASALITKLLAMPTAGGVTEEGMYRKGDEIFRVQRSLESGNLYAKKLDVVEMKFIFASGAIRTIKSSDKMTLDEAKAFGVETGFCCVCAKFLTDPKSVANGIGPVCAKNV